MASKKENFTSPCGRLVAGSLYKGQDKDAEGRPLLVKNGPNTGQPRLDFYFALAIPKDPAAPHWASTEWGAKIWAAGHAFMGTAGSNPKFAWKVQDGDSQVPNAKGRKPCDREGWAGHWILSYSSGYTPKVYSLVGNAAPALFPQEDAVNLGDYVQVNGDVGGNDSMQQPGVFINHNMVCLIGYGTRIVVGPDVSAAGFGAGVQLPPGASTTPPPAPPGAMAAAMPPPPPGAPAPGGMPPPPPVPGAALPPPPAPPAPPAALPPPPAAPAPAPGPVMTAAANGASYASLIAAGWTDATLVQHGMMQVAAPLPPAGSALPPPPAAPIVVAPNPAFTTLPAPPGLPPAPPAAPARVMTAAANGASYASLIQAGWTDATLVEQGLMLA